MNSCNTFDKPELIKSKALNVKVSGENELYVTVPAMSVVTLSIEA